MCANFCKIEKDFNSSDHFKEAISDFLFLASPHFLKDSDLSIECLEKVILFLIHEYNISEVEFNRILSKILEDI